MIFRSMRDFKIHYIPRSYEHELRDKIALCPKLQGELMASELLDSIRRKLKGEPDAKINERIANLERIVKTARRIRY